MGEIPDTFLRGCQILLDIDMIWIIPMFGFGHPDLTRIDKTFGRFMKKFSLNLKGI